MEKDKEFQWVSDSNKTDKYQGVAAPKEEDLSPEEILKKHFEAKGYIFDHFKNWLDFKVHLPTIYAAMGEYAAIHVHTQVMNQVHRIKELKELEEALKELLPVAQWGYDLLVPFDKKGMGREWPAIIERARKLISK